MLNYKYIGISVVLYSLHFSQFCMGLVSCQLIVQLSLFSFWYFIFILYSICQQKSTKYIAGQSVLYFISVSSFFRVFLVLFGGWYRVSYLRKVFPSIFLRMELCGPFFPSISWGFYCVASAYMRLVCRSIFLGMVLCGISAPSFPRYFPGDGIMWHICA